MRMAHSQAGQSRAQRLAASQRSAHLHAPVACFAVICAQRLAASQRSARMGPLPPPPPQHVLNALRHHRGRHGGNPNGSSDAMSVCSTPCGITEVGTAPGRPDQSSEFASAQRLAASQRSALCSAGFGPITLTCSTPCGITEVGTSWMPWSRLVAPGRVLNALRHHRGRHGDGDSSSESSMMECSTPCGITEVGTTQSSAVISAVLSVLNALRHHRGRHVNPAPNRVEPGIGAQRLAASQRSAQPIRQLERPDLGRCSTPCGITEVGTGSLLTPIVCQGGAQRLAASLRSAQSPPWDDPSLTHSAQRLAASQRSARHCCDTRRSLG